MSLTTEAIAFLDPEQANDLDNAFEQLCHKLPERDVRAFAQEVILRLAQRLGESATCAARPGPTEIDALSRDLISSCPDAALNRIVGVIKNGATIENVYLDHLAAAARRLGEFWETDEASFVEVTIGTGRIYGIMRRLVASRMCLVTPRDRTAIIATLPGEQHSLGAQMATDLARLEGWEIRLQSDRSHDEILREVAQSGAAVIGITAMRRESLGPLARLIAAIRIVDPTVRVLVSGRIAEVEREAVDWMDPDAVATTMPEAIAALERLHDEGFAARLRVG